MSEEGNETEEAIVEAHVKEVPFEETVVGDPTSDLKPEDAVCFGDIKTSEERVADEGNVESDHHDEIGQVVQEEVKEGVVSEPIFEGEGIVWDYYDQDVLSGRGAWVNAHKGNQKFRALCFSRKPEFDVGNHAAKRRIATEIVEHVKSNEGHFLRKKEQKGPWYKMTDEQSILKACQVMRDHKRPDRVAMREAALQNGNQRRRIRSSESTPMGDIPVAPTPAEPIIENPYGVHSNDILSGRGAYVNGHVGNQKFREWAMERKERFDAGNFAEKRALATEVVQLVRALDPPGRFLRRIDPNKPPNGPVDSPPGLEGLWIELNDEEAIHKSCQVMRDIDRPDRKDRGSRKKRKLEEANKKDGESQNTAEASTGSVDGAMQESTPADGPDLSAVEPTPLVDESSSLLPPDTMEINDSAETKESIALLTDNPGVASTIEEAMAATEEALNKALDAVPVSKVEEPVPEVDDSAVEV